MTGHTAETTTIPADWDPTDPNTWTLSTTVDAHMGYHHTGMVMREYQTVTHAATGYDAGNDLDYDEAAGAWSSPDGQSLAQVCAWWYAVLGPLHAAGVAIAEASPESLAAATRALDMDRVRIPYDDMGLAGYIADNDGDLEIAASRAAEVIAALDRA